ncbi:hypothetical protein E2C06_33625 [Dankookia rubra]|uniref:Uncharacterized protein n=1 Tax=Dankookia rubra TaxID=1442381 RepID=A0A4R5Q5S5_9PROT|nr:hypothetical protein [Dankookia rubra]TDH58230.1 hypothetical protein E2C06_33625 [Dankookia rubra]
MALSVQPPDATDHEQRMRKIGLIIAMIMVAMVCLVFLINIVISIFFTDSMYFQMVLKDHLAVFLGFPQMAGTSYAIVVFLRQTEGPFEFKALGMEAKGASGQVVMWVFALVSFTLLAKLIW